MRARFTMEGQEEGVISRVCAQTSTATARAPHHTGEILKEEGTRSDLYTCETTTDDEFDNRYIYSMSAAYAAHHLIVNVKADCCSGRIHCATCMSGGNGEVDGDIEVHSIERVSNALHRQYQLCRSRRETANR
jgi:hypothetical protein